MSRLTLGIFFSLVIVMFITAYNYTPQTVEGNTCQVGTVCSKPDCCNKEKSCGSGCVKPCCKLLDDKRWVRKTRPNGISAYGIWT